MAVSPYVIVAVLLSVTVWPISVLSVLLFRAKQIMTTTMMMMMLGHFPRRGKYQTFISYALCLIVKVYKHSTIFFCISLGVLFPSVLFDCKLYNLCLLHCVLLSTCMSWINTTTYTTATTTMWGKKTAAFYFCNGFVRASSIKTIFGTHYTPINFLSYLYSIFFI